MRWPNGSQSRPWISSGFGPRSPGIGSSIHRGCDFTGFTHVRAVASGTVRVVGTPGGWSAGGRQVWVQHNGFFSRSMHLASTSVRNGQRVNEGDILGVMGRTGTATGVHLHLEITSGNLHYSNSGQVDPVPYIQARLSGGSWPARERYGADWVKSIQTKLVLIGYELGSHGVDGKDGPATQGAVRDVQSKHGLTVDGIAGPDTNAVLDRIISQTVGENRTSRPTVDIQRLVGANPDGIWGKETGTKVKAWQKKNGLEADGIWGPKSDAKGFPARDGYIPIKVDGDWGIETTRALQDSLGVEVDGELGPDTFTAMQIATGNPNVDGDWGPESRRYLQAALGVAQDGITGYDTVSALQTLLNSGGKLTPGDKEADPEPTPEPEPTPMPEQPDAATYPGAIWWGHSPNYSNRDYQVDLFIIHHTTETGEVENLRDYMMRKNDRNVSANWLIAQNGDAHEIVPPDEYRAWTSGAIDHRAVTVETMNTTGAPDWKVSNESIEALAQLVAWAAKRYSFPIDRTHVIGHREVPGAATACPGPYLFPRLDDVVARAIEISTPVTPDPDPDPDSVLVSRAWLEAVGKGIDDLLE